jgi:hypothetical protein
MRRALTMLAIAAVVSLSLVHVAGGGGDGARQCAAAKLKAAAKKAASKLKCQARAEAAGVAADPACLAKAEDKFAAAFARAEAGGGCRTMGDAGATESAVDDFVAKLAVLLSASTTTSTTSTSTTNSTCTTTTTFPPCQLVGSVCGGPCPGGQTCEPDGGGGCACVGPPPSCCAAGHQFCSAGVCPAGLTCQPAVPDQCGVPTTCECR